MQPITTEADPDRAAAQTAELIRRSQAGEAVAFEALYREHVGAVHALCVRMSGERRLAAELTQDVFVRAWRAIGGFRGDAAFGTWLHRIAYNVVRDAQRSERRRRLRIVEDADGSSVEAIARTGDISDEARIDLERAIAQLPARARNALVLHDIHGYRCREVAELMDCAVGTIQSHLHRARRMLREILER